MRALSYILSCVLVSPMCYSLSLHSFLQPTLKKIATASVIASAVLFGDSAVRAADTSVYFGVGCFWHVQHEFVETEKQVLGRSDKDVNSYAGYAGGTKISSDKARGPNGVVCYHNMIGMGDYGDLGYGEVVGMKVPDAKYGAFADQYFSLFGKDSERPDKGKQY